jgi:ankyrin repeat protein
VGRGLTPFLLACAIGDIDVVRQLLKHGANVKLATSDAQGPLILAVEFSNGDKAELINLLAAEGADVDLMARRHFLQRTRGGSALHYAPASALGAAWTSPHGWASRSSPPCRASPVW